MTSPVNPAEPDSPINPGKVVWSGENPGIYLKDAQGEWQALASYFRVVTSPFGPGAGMLVLGAPRRAAGWPDAPNFCLSTSEPMMRWLVKDFVSQFASFRGMDGLAAMTYLAADSTRTDGDGRFHQETVGGAGVVARMRWDGLSSPFAVDVPRAMSATGKHQMVSVFVEAESASIQVNDQALPGQVIERDFLGRRMRTALLAFSETWIEPAAR